MKRFYKEVAVAPADGGFAVLLDGRPVKTPARNTLVLPTENLAAAIAAEWRGQGGEIIATSMPLLRLANSVIDGVTAKRDEVVDAVMRFADNDLLCYRAHQPPDLVARQSAGWDPWLDWARRRHGAAMTVAAGFNHVDQTPDALMALRQAAAELDAFALGALHVIASITGSLVLALAVADGAASGAQVFHLSRTDEIYQAEKWGEDAEAAKRATALAHELDKAVELIALARA
ncbi:MAG TPA: ATP12 family protein [Rhizomicrobium sp.]|jgi:chaperone required for assembly of F1-ATPase